MNLKDIVHKLGFHSWTEWEYVIPDICEQTRRCSYDGVTQRRTQHEWLEGSSGIRNQCCYDLGGIDSICLRCDAKNPVQPQQVSISEQICSGCGAQLDAFMNC